MAVAQLRSGGKPPVFCSDSSFVELRRMSTQSGSERSLSSYSSVEVSLLDDFPSFDPALAKQQRHKTVMKCLVVA